MADRKQGFFEVRHPFFRPFWRRALVTGAILGWAVFEYVNGSPAWSILFGVCGVYLFLQFFVNFDPADYEETAGDDR